MTTTKRTPAQNSRDFASYFITLIAGLAMTDQAAETARLIADGSDDEDARYTARILANSLDLLSDHFRIMAVHLRESILELQAANGGASGGSPG